MLEPDLWPTGKSLKSFEQDSNVIRLMHWEDYFGIDGKYIIKRGVTDGREAN